MSRQRVVVVGSGISGLATAYFLSRPQVQPPGATPPDVIVLESAERSGGKILTQDVAGLPVDTGPDAILARSPVLVQLLTDLGLEPRLSRQATLGAFVWARGRLRRLPPSSLFGVPDTPLPLLRSGLLSPAGALRAGADFVLPRQKLPADPTIAQLLRPRFGREVFELLVEPLLGGVHAGRAEALSARSAVPEVYRAARANRSTYLALRERRRTRHGAPARPTGFGMVSLQGGLHTLVQALGTALPAPVRTGVTVTAIEPRPSGVRVVLDGAERVDADAVVLATPAYVSSALLRPLSVRAATALDGIPYVGVAIVTLAYRPGDVGRVLDGTGFLVPPASGRWIVGCTWSTVKWQHLASDEVVLLRCAVGRHGDQRWQELSDEELIAQVHGELAWPMGLTAAPRQGVVTRWPDAMPQYTVGHEHRLVQLATALYELPGVHLTGAAYRGVGISGCVQQAADVAATVLDRLRRPGPVPRAIRPGSLARPAGERVAR